MTTKHENTFWQRRVASITIGVAGLIVVLYIASLLVSTFPVALSVGLVPATLAAGALVAAALSYVPLTKKVGDAFLPLGQGLLIIAAATLIHSTGGAASHFAALWLPATIFIGILGVQALALVAVLPLGYGVWLAVTDELTLPLLMTIILVGELPVLISHLLFSHSTAQKQDSSYTQLADQFSQVSDKAEVVINAITNGVLALDKQGIIGLINPAAQRLIGWESHDALKLDYKSVLKLIDNESNELTPANDPIRKALSTNEEVRTEDFTLVTNSGKKLLVALVASPVGQVGSGVIVVFRDITKEKAEEREQTEFISTASHEMRTPVATIEGYLGLALNPATAQIDDKARAYLTKAHEVAQHLGRLFQDLLDITKAEDGRLSSDPRAVEVVSFAQDIVEGLRPQAEAKGLILIYKPIPDTDNDEKANRRLNPVFYANVDNDHLREVISNLVENAIKYTKQGSVSVDIGGDDKQIEISIQDTGIGVPAEDLSHLFQKFYRVDNSDTREIGGTGLGLYLSRRLVETMEGRVWAESQHGQGSTFFISIPRISHQEAMQLIETLESETPSVTGVTAPAFEVPPLEPVAPMPAQEVPLTDPAPGSGVFASVPADVIAAQLTATPATIAPQPVAPQQPQYVQPAPPMSGPSLAAIEQDPSSYLSRTHGSLNVPPRAGVVPENHNQP